MLFLRVWNNGNDMIFFFLFSKILSQYSIQTWKMLQYQLRLLQYNLKKAWPQPPKPVGWNLVEICPLRPWKDVQSYGYELLLNALWNPPWPVRQIWNRMVNLRSGLTTTENMTEVYHWRPKKLDQPFFKIRLFVDKNRNSCLFTASCLLAILKCINKL